MAKPVFSCNPLIYIYYIYYTKLDRQPSFPYIGPRNPGPADMLHTKERLPPAPDGSAFDAPAWATAGLVLSDGTVFWGRGLGARGTAVGEVCFNTSMTGYQEIMTDPSYAGQIITFTFPHIGNTGTNPEDIETLTPAARGVVLRTDITEPSNWRAHRHLDVWLESQGLVGISGVDTRALTCRIRDLGAPAGCIAHLPPDEAALDHASLKALAAAWPGLEGMDLAGEVTCRQTYRWDETRWLQGQGFGRLEAPEYKVVAVDFGAKRNILRCLASLACDVTVVPASATAEDILVHEPDGIFLSNGPGDPAATGVYAVPMVRALLEAGLPGTPDPGPGVGCRNLQDAAGPPRRQPPGQGAGLRQGRDHQPEPRLRGGGRQPAGRRGADPPLAVRRLERRHPPRGAAGLFRPIPSRGFARPPGQPLPFRAIRRLDEIPLSRGSLLDHPSQPHLRQRVWIGVPEAAVGSFASPARVG